MFGTSEIAEVETPTLHLERFQGVITAGQYEQLMAAAERARQFFAGRTVWNINSTAAGGGVAEMLRSLVAYIRGAGINARWLVIPGSPDFFTVTKRIHNHLHGVPGDGGYLGDAARRTYEDTLRPTIEALVRIVSPGDVVLVHDPQPAGVVPELMKVTSTVVWRCHVGIDEPNDLARHAWRFLLPYVSPAAAYVFSRATFAWDSLERSKIWVIPPSIDAFSTKNRELRSDQVESILTAAGIVAGDLTSAPWFEREDGSLGRVSRRAEMVEVAPATIRDRLVVQVSRWDALKDPVGVIRGFAEHVTPRSDAHLVMAGPAVEAVSDDPEGLRVLEDCVRTCENLGPPAAARIHLATLPMTDREENAAIVNALQRRAEVVVQKSLAEGFGLTVAEAMWKGRPTVASRIGGIQDQIEHGRTGMLLEDPRDLATFGEYVSRLLADQELAAAIGRAAREKVRDYFLPPRHLMRYMELIGAMPQD